MERTRRQPGCFGVVFPIFYDYLQLATFSGLFILYTIFINRYRLE